MAIWLVSFLFFFSSCLSIELDCIYHITKCCIMLVPKSIYKVIYTYINRALIFLGSILYITAFGIVHLLFKLRYNYPPYHARMQLTEVRKFTFFCKCMRKYFTLC